jgi:hypothetical protein
MIERCEQAAGLLITGATLDPDGALGDGRQAYLHVEHSRDFVRKLQPLQSRHR